MQFIIQYGCAQKNNCLAAECDDYKEAKNFAQENAFEVWESCGNKPEKYSEAWWDTVYNEIEYTIIPFDRSNKHHLLILEEQDYRFFNI